MQKQFKALLIGGPPHSGKSTLAYRLSAALRAQKISHYLLRANPDGEGNWFYESNDSIIQELRKNNKKSWTQSFTKDITNFIAQTPAPLLVDTGGIPSEDTYKIAKVCQKAIIIAPNPALLHTWEDFIHEAQIQLLASFISDLSGEQQVYVEKDTLYGIIHGLSKDMSSDGVCFSALTQQIKQEFEYSEIEMFAIHKSQITDALVFQLNRMHMNASIWPDSDNWKPEELSILLAALPSYEPLALYGVAPNWVYAAIAANTTLPLKIFTMQYGWVDIPLSELPIRNLNGSGITWTAHTALEKIYLQGNIHKDYLSLAEMTDLSVPNLPNNLGVILSGKLPQLVYAIAVRKYRKHLWVAVYQPQLNGSVVVFSQTSQHKIGDIITVDNAYITNLSK